MLDLQNHFTGTYAKMVLADWPLMSDCIRQQTIWVKDTIQSRQETDPLKPTVLTDLQISDALNGPLQAFFKCHLQAYSAIKKMDTALTISKEDFFKDSEHINEKIFAMPESLLATMEFSTLTELRKQLDEKTKAHYEQWQSTISDWVTQLLAEFKKNNLKLSDIEVKDFSINQPASELNDRFINLKLTLPKLHKTHFDFQQYFTLKAMLTIQSALNRTQQPRTEKDIEQQLKMLQPLLKKINQAEKELQNTQQKTVAQLIAAIQF